MKLSDSQLFMAANNIVARWVDPQLPEDNYKETKEGTYELAETEELVGKIGEEVTATAQAPGNRRLFAISGGFSPSVVYFFLCIR